MKKTKPKPIPECDRPGRRCYARGLSKDIGLQIYDRYAGDGAYGVILEINLHPNLVRKAPRTDRCRLRLGKGIALTDPGLLRRRAMAAQRDGGSP